MKFTDAYWYRFISFDPYKVGNAKIAKNAVFGIGIDDDTGRYFIWFANSNEKLFIEHADVEVIVGASRPYNGKINGTPVESGKSAKELVVLKGKKSSDIMPQTKPTAVKTKIKESRESTTPEPTDDAIARAVTKYPFVYGLVYRPYSLVQGTVCPIGDHAFFTVSEWEAYATNHANHSTDSRYFVHGVVMYPDKLSKSDAEDYQLYPLNHKLEETKEEQEEVADTWRSVIFDFAEDLIRNKHDSFKMTSAGISDLLAPIMKSKWLATKMSWAVKHPDYVTKEQDPQQYDLNSVYVNLISIDELESHLVKYIDRVEDPDYVEEIENEIVKDIRDREGIDLNVSGVDHHIKRMEDKPSIRTRYIKQHPDYLARHDDMDSYYRLEDALLEINLERIKEELMEYVSKKVEETRKISNPTVDTQLPNNPTSNLKVSKHPVSFSMTRKPIDTIGGTTYPCSDPEILDLMDKIEDHLGNLMPMRLGHLVWGIAPSTSMITYGSKAQQVLTISPDQIRKIYGRCDFATLGSAITHEMAHYVFNQILKNSEKMRFKQMASLIKLHSSQTTSGSSYPFYHEQFAMLAEYGVWGTCARGLQSVVGWETVAKYFDITQHITSDIIAKYNK